MKRFLEYPSLAGCEIAQAHEATKLHQRSQRLTRKGQGLFPANHEFLNGGHHASTTPRWGRVQGLRRKPKTVTF